MEPSLAAGLSDLGGADGRRKVTESRRRMMDSCRVMIRETAKKKMSETIRLEDTLK